MAAFPEAAIRRPVDIGLGAVEEGAGERCSELAVLSLLGSASGRPGGWAAACPAGRL